MNISLPKQSFLKLLYLTHGIVERRNTMPILSHVKLSANQGKLAVAATDLEVSLIGEVDANVITAGAIAVDAKVIYEIIRELPEGELSLKLGQNNRLEINLGQSRFKIIGVSADEFPSLVGLGLNSPITVEAAVIHEMVNKTVFAVSTDETRYNINGVYAETIKGALSPNSESLRFVATDGHRLAIIDREAEGFRLDKPVIIPKKGVLELRKVIEGNDGVARVSVNDGFFTVQSGDITFGARLMDGQFPDYRQVIPTENTTTVDLSTQDFLAAVKRVSLVTTDKSKAVRLKLINGSLLISSSSPEYGEASDNLTVTQNGEDVEIGFSSRYLIDLLTSMAQSETVTIKFAGSFAPGVFFANGDESFRCVVMPMRFE